MTNFTAKKMILVIFLCLVMVSVTAVSFVYWKSEITGNEKDKSLNINIGSGNAVETVVSLSHVELDGKFLVPVGRANDATKTDRIEFSVDVTWQPNGTLQTSDEDNFKLHTGQLTIRLNDILLEGEDSIKNLQGLTGKLFNVSFTAVHNIKGTQTITVDFVVTMNEPANKTQYDMIADKDISIILDFEIESQFDLGNMQ